MDIWENKHLTYEDFSIEYCVKILFQPTWACLPHPLPPSNNTGTLETKKSKSILELYLHNLPLKPRKRYYIIIIKQPFKQLFNSVVGEQTKICLIDVYHVTIDLYYYCSKLLRDIIEIIRVKQVQQLYHNCWMIQISAWLIVIKEARWSAN